MEISTNRPNGLIGRAFANGLEDQGWILPKTQKMVLDASKLNTPHYKVRIKSKVEQSRERSSVIFWPSTRPKNTIPR